MKQLYTRIHTYYKYSIYYVNAKDKTIN